MRTITKDELADILKKHALWLIGDIMGVRANLCGANLCGADLSRANLYEADLYGANLCGANLYEADLSRANLCGANLCGANLSRANLYEADLSRANLYEADLSRANLYEADLSRANLYEADLYGANLCGANLYEAENVNYLIACPEKGSFTAFKKANGYIVELEIPSDALRSSASSRKCRCSKAKVISITDKKGNICEVTSVPSGYDGNFIYTVGETVKVDNFDTNRWNECAPGIHFFITRQEAVDY